MAGNIHDKRFAETNRDKTYKDTTSCLLLSNDSNTKVMNMILLNFCCLGTSLYDGTIVTQARKHITFFFGKKNQYEHWPDAQRRKACMEEKVQQTHARINIKGMHQKYDNYANLIMITYYCNVHMHRIRRQRLRTSPVGSPLLA